MARGWHYTKLCLSSAHLLSFSGMCFLLLFLSFCRFYFVSLCLFCFLLSLELCRCSSDLFLPSRPRCTGLATTYITGYGGSLLFVFCSCFIFSRLPFDQIGKGFSSVTFSSLSSFICFLDVAMVWKGKPATVTTGSRDRTYVRK